MIKIITDSSCDLKNIRLVYDRNGERVRYARAPLTIRVGEQEFVDDDKLDVAQMMETMQAYSGSTASSCPSPAAWCDAFEDADEIYVITITSALSGSYNSAITAKEIMMETHPEKKIFILDSLSTGPEMTLLVQRLLHLISQGGTFRENVEEIKAYHKSTRLAFVLHSTDNLVKNGRVSRLAGFAVNVLGITIIGRASVQGELEMVAKHRTSRKVEDTIIAEMQLQGYDGGAVTITHCLNEKAAMHLRDHIRQVYPQASVTIMPTGGLCSYYAENQGLLIGYEAVAREYATSGEQSATGQPQEA